MADGEQDMNSNKNVVQIASEMLGGDDENKPDDVPEFDPELGLHNITDSEFKEYFELCDEIQESRDILTEKKALGLAMLVGKGADQAGIGAAYKRWKTEQHKRRKFDQTYMRLTKLMGVQHQEELSLFDDVSGNED